LFIDEGAEGSAFHEIESYDGSSSEFRIEAEDTVGGFIVTVGRIYRIKTRAVNSIEESEFSEELVVALARSPEKPGAPSFDVEASSKRSIALNWVDGASLDIPVLGYRLYSDNG